MRKLNIIFILFAITLIGNSSKLFAQSGQELVDICGMVAGDAMYLKDFQIKLDAANPGEEPPTSRFSVVLSKNTEYLFSICNSNDYSGEAVLKLYDNNRLLATNHMVATGKTFQKVKFKCSSTGAYHIFITFKEGEQGLAVALLSFVERF